MVGMIAEIGVRVLWENYCYDFGGKTFKQKEGGPIGQRPTMAASRIIMTDFFVKYCFKISFQCVSCSLLAGEVILFAHAVISGGSKDEYIDHQQVS